MLNVNDFCSIKFNSFFKSNFREIFSSFQYLAISIFRDILIFGFLRHFIPAIFYLKVTK